MKIEKIIGEGDSLALSNVMMMMAGSGHLYKQNFDVLYQNLPFNPLMELLDEEVSGLLMRSNSGDHKDPNFFFLKHVNYVGSLAGVVVPFNLQYSHNYFHFLIESLPSLLSLNNHYIIKNRKVTLVTGRLNQNFKFILDKVLQTKFNLVELLDLGYVEGQNCIYPKPSFIGRELLDKKMPECIYIESNIAYARKILRDTFREFFVAKPTNKLFVIRAGSLRNITNLAEVVAEAKKYGYTVFSPEMFSIPDQIKIFSSAMTVVGPTGAWLSNMIFMHEGSEVIVLHPLTTYSKISIWKKLGKILGLDVSDHYFKITFFNKPHPLHSDFLVDINILKIILSGSKKVGIISQNQTDISNSNPPVISP